MPRLKPNYRRLFQFRVSSLLWLTTICSVALCVLSLLLRTPDGRDVLLRLTACATVAAVIMLPFRWFFEGPSFFVFGAVYSGIVFLLPLGFFIFLPSLFFGSFLGVLAAGCVPHVQDAVNRWLFRAIPESLPDFEIGGWKNRKDGAEIGGENAPEEAQTAPLEIDFDDGEEATDEGRRA